MSIISTLALKNKAGAAVTFIRELGTSTGVVLRDAAETVFNRAARVKMDTVMPGAKGNVVRSTGQLICPVYDEAGLKLRELRFSYEFLLPVSSTQVEREELHARMKELMISATVQAAVVAMDNPT